MSKTIGTLLAKNIIEDVKVELTQQFDRNFERKAFFNTSWKNTNHPNSRGSLLNRTGKLRRSINKPRTQGTAIRWTSNVPYASIHNEGGEITVTAKMKRYFWAMHYMAVGAVSYSVKTKKANNTIRNKKLSAEAKKWKYMALMKVGTTLKVEQRQFIGWHPQVDVSVARVVDINIKELELEIKNNLKR